MEYGFIPDANVTASSEHPLYPATKGRLGHTSAWCSLADSLEGYIQINLSTTYVICAIATQGHSNDSLGFVDKYRLQFSVSGNDWTFYKIKEGKEVCDLETL